MNTAVQHHRAIRPAEVPADVPEPGGRTSALRRTVLLGGMLLAPWCYVVANAAYAWAIRDGGSDVDGAATLALAAADGDLLRVALVAVMLGGILIVPAVLGFLRLAPTSRLVAVGGALMAAGYICYAGVAQTGFVPLAMAERGGPMDDYAAVLDAAVMDPAAMWAFLVFILGNLVGTLVLAVGLWLSRTAPRWAALAIASWPPLHIIGLAFLPNEVPQVLGAILQALGFAGCAIALLRIGRLD
jgi:hypothetical protein